MRRLILTVIVIAVTALASQANGKLDFNVGVAGGEPGMTSFYMELGNYNRIQENDVIVVRQRGIPDEELAVVFFIASRAGVHYDEVIKLRLKRWPWMKIVRNYRLNPAIFYVPVQEKVKKGPYGRAYGYYQNKPQDKWQKMNLSDRDIINCVNLRFVSEHYGYSPYEVIRMRESGRRFVEINNEVNKLQAEARARIKQDNNHKKKHR